MKRVQRLAISNWQIAKPVGALLLDPKDAPDGLGSLLAAKDSTFGLAALRAWSLAAPSTAIGFCVMAISGESRGAS